MLSMAIISCLLVLPYVEFSMSILYFRTVCLCVNVCVCVGMGVGRGTGVGGESDSLVVFRENGSFIFLPIWKHVPFQYLIDYTHK